MSSREELAAALLNALAPIEPRVCESDMLFFGEAADVSSPLPVKYRLDITPGTVYNIKTTTFFRGAPLFAEVWASGGFLNFGISPEAWRLIAGDPDESLLDEEPPEIFELSTGPAAARALLLSLARASNEEGGIPPSDPVIKRAFRFCLMADTEGRQRLAAKAVFDALSNHRRAKALCEKSALITKDAALAMAAALDKNLN